MARREFRVLVPARFIKDPNISPQAKLLRVILGAFADGKTGRTYVGLRTVERLMGCGRDARRRAQRELVRAGWLRLERKPAARGRWGCRLFILCEPRSPGPELTAVVEIG